MVEIKKLVETGPIVSGRGRAGGRRTRREAREHAPIAWLPALKRRIPVLELVPEEAVERINDASCAAERDHKPRHRPPGDEPPRGSSARGSQHRLTPLRCGDGQL